jgi:hypothetical protein
MCYMLVGCVCCGCSRVVCAVVGVCVPGGFDYTLFFIRPYAQIGPRRGKRGKGKRHKRHEGQRPRQHQEAEAEAKGTGREARGTPPGPARTYKTNFPVRVGVVLCLSVSLVGVLVVSLVGSVVVVLCAVVCLDVMVLVMWASRGPHDRGLTSTAPNDYIMLTRVCNFACTRYLLAHASAPLDAETPSHARPQTYVK